MSALTGFWLCLTPIVWAVAGYRIDKHFGEQGEERAAAAVSAVLVVPLWWAVYFIIKGVWS